MSFPRLVIGIVSTTLIVGGSLWVSAASSQACFRTSQLAGNSSSQSNPLGQDGVTKGFLGRAPWSKAAAVGFVSLAGLMSAGMIYQRRLRKGTAIAPAPLHPELDHPELLLTTFPKEAFSNHLLPVEEAQLEREVALTR